MYATCYPDYCFCESLREGLILQPSNTFSAIAFIVAGIFVFWRYRTFSGYFYAFLLIFIGLGTGFYHARLGFIGQSFDIAGMYLLVTFAILSLSLHLKYPKNLGVFFSSYILLNATLISLIFFLPSLRRYIFVILLLALIRVLLKNGISRKVFYGAMAAMAIGGVFWVLDITKVACNPESIVQGHAIWHILSAVASVLLFNTIEPVINPSGKGQNSNH